MIFATELVYPGDMKTLDLFAFQVYTPDMSDTARDYQTSDSATIEGLDELFDEGANLVKVVRELDAIPPPIARESVEYIDVEEAASRLGISVRAVQKRLKKGSLVGSKVKTGSLERWVIDAACLPSVELACPVPTLIEVDANPVEFVRELVSDQQSLDANSLDGVREQGANQDSNRFKDELIKELQHKLEAASYRLGYLEHQVETQNSQIKLLTDSQHKGGWWAKFSSWFFKGK